MSSQPEPKDIFATTHWTAVLRAGRADTRKAEQALAELCQTYWYPLYCYVRRRGYSPQDSEDLTQGFFARLLRLESLTQVTPERGKFRAFMLAALKNYLADQQRHTLAQKRDARLSISLDTNFAERKLAMVSSNGLPPDRHFDRQWALTLLDRVMRQLATDYETAGKAELFRELRFSIAGSRSAVPYHELAARLNLKETALRVAIHRLRKEYRRRLETEIANTVSEPGEIEQEISELRRILSAE